MVKKKSWSEFRDTGLLWFINCILHVFGWAIVIEADKHDYNKIFSVYPARVTFRGFSGSSNEKGYERITKYLKENINQLFEDVIKS